jgi:predicted RNA-binding protein with PIN domain
MSYLIDGNNLMKTFGIETRKTVLEKLSGFAKTKKISVVFDGSEESFFPDGSSYKGIRVFYSKTSDADSWIKTFVENSKEKHTLIVVTDDLELSSYCRRCGAKTISTRNFRIKLEKTKPRKDEKENLAVKPEEINEWMRYFGIEEND